MDLFLWLKYILWRDNCIASVCLLDVRRFPPDSSDRLVKAITVGLSHRSSRFESNGISEAIWIAEPDADILGGRFKLQKLAHRPR